MVTYDWNCKTVDCYPEQNSEADEIGRASCRERV